jgi:uncharacterized protein (DUF4213/DUF364 family)
MNILDDIISTIKEDAPVKEVRTAAFWTAVVSRNCGLASTVRMECTRHGSPQVRSAGELPAESALEMARLSQSKLYLEASIGLAAINSLLDVDESRCADINAASEFWVIEKDPKPGDLPEEDSAHILPQADVVAISGTTLINHTFDDVISHCRKDSFKVMLGPTTPLSPVLLDYGLDVICGSKVSDVALALKCISEGANFRQVRGVRLLCMM